MKHRVSRFVPRMTLLSAHIVPLFALLIGPTTRADWNAASSTNSSLVRLTETQVAAQPLAPVKPLASCDETGLRDAVMNAMSGDVIDLTACSHITLTTGEIHVPVDELTLLGPGPEFLTIDGGAATGMSGGYTNRIFDHTGIGTLWIDGLTLSNAHYIGVNIPEGGCIYSSGAVKLTNAVVTQCLLDVPSTNAAYAQGGAIYAREGVTMQASVVTKSTAYSALRGAYGGGVFSHGTFSASYSTISDNVANSFAKYSAGGGVFALGAGDFMLANSTVSGNAATDAAGADVRSTGVAEVVSSTISMNSADRYVGGAAFQNDVKVASSTITDNQAAYITYGIGLQSSGVATLQSSILTNNFAGLYSADVSAQAIDGFRNIILTASGPTPFDTIHACAKLGPLAENGGPTRTRMPLAGSYAIDAGDPVNTAVDQRGSGFSRIYGGLADIGAVEWHGELGDEIFKSAFEVRCDSYD